MEYDKRLIHCDENELVSEIESYVVDEGLIVSMKEVRPGGNQPFAELRRQLESEGWEIQLAGVTPLGKAHRPANSYVALRPRQPQDSVTGK